MNQLYTLYNYSQTAFFVFTAIFGAIIGSFLSVCIFRIPFGRPKGPPTLEELSGLNDEAQSSESVEANLEYENAQSDAVQNNPVQNNTVQNNTVQNNTVQNITVQKNTVEQAENLTIGNPPRSFCPNCKHKLLWWHNIPILSWLFLGGRCYFCKQRVSFRYPLVEILSAAFAVAALYKFGPTPTAFLVFVYCATLIVISFIDIDYYIIPDVISWPGMAVGLMLGLLNHYFNLFGWPFAETIWDSLIGLACGGGILLFISELYLRIRKRVGLGLGDIKLLGMTGAFFGYQGAFATIFIGSLLGSILGLSLMICFRKSLTQHLPFGPYLALGTIVYIFAGPGLIFRF